MSKLQCWLWYPPCKSLRVKTYLQIENTVNHAILLITEPNYFATIVCQYNRVIVINANWFLFPLIFQSPCTAVVKRNFWRVFISKEVEQNKNNTGNPMVVRTEKSAIESTCKGSNQVFLIWIHLWNLQTYFSEFS